MIPVKILLGLKLILACHMVLNWSIILATSQ